MLKLLKGLSFQGKVCVLCFHRISPEPSSAWPPLHPSVFRELLQYLSKHFRIISFAELAFPIKTDKPAVILSFDDGYYDFIEYALPVISTFKVSVNHNFVVHSVDTGELIWTQRINNIIDSCFTEQKDFKFKNRNIELEILPGKHNAQRISVELFNKFSQLRAELNTTLSDVESQLRSLPVQRMMGWEDLKTCIKNNVEIGSHSHSHPLLLSSLGEEKLREEIIDSKFRLEKQLLQEISIFAFPNGIYDALSLETARKAGYKFILSTQNKKYSQTDKDLVPRTLIRHTSLNENLFNIHGLYRLLSK